MRMVLGLVMIVLAAAPIRAEVPGLRVPDGFDIRQFATEELANDITCMTIDAQGRITVSGPGYTKLLIDRDGDGKADQAQKLADFPKQGAQGLMWDADTLFLVGDGGLWSLDQGKLTKWVDLPTGSDHLSHAIKRGPDGWLYWMVGDATKIDARWASGPQSPVKEPIGGCLVRVAPDGQSTEIFAHGFRNAYDFDFNSRGDIFTYDSDNERCVSLPWQEATRLYHVRRGAFHGWPSPQRAQTWRMPPYFVDVATPVAHLRRGSPTGVVGYRHTQFPERYQDGIFAADWTFGRIWFLPIRPEGDTYRAKGEIFVQPQGDFGFAPTAMAVHPISGELYISVGGRGTRGSVYTIRAKDGPANPKPLAFKHNPLPARAADEVEKLIPIARENPGAAIAPALAIVRDAQKPLRDRLRAVRIVQIAMGDIGSVRVIGTVWEGYTLKASQLSATELQTIIDACRSVLPAETLGDEERYFRRELLRTIGLAERPAPEVVRQIAAGLTADSDAVEDIHALIVLAKIPGERPTEVTERCATALLALDAKLDGAKRNRDRNWPLRIGEMYTGLIVHDPLLPTAVLASPEFGRPDHELFTRITGIDRAAIARKFIARSKADTNFAWNGDLLQLLAKLPSAEARPVWLTANENGWSDTVLPLLAKLNNPEDRPRFLAGLRSPRLNIVAECAEALGRLPVSKAPSEWGELIHTLRRLPPGKNEDPIRVRLALMLQAATGQMLGTDASLWVEWFTKAHPDVAAKVFQSNIDWAAWKKRLDAVDWDKGDAARGKVVFGKTTCIACHGGNQRLGPDLSGVTTRFPRPDLFQAIVEPSKDVSSRFQATQYETKDGKLYIGLPVYEAVDGVILQTGSGTVRLDGPQIEAKALSTTSLMPSGLIDKCSDAELADLYAYLKTIGTPAAP